MRCPLRWKIAAKVCTEALEAGDTSLLFLSKYQRLWNNDFGKEIKLCLLILKRLLEKDSGEKYVRLISRDPQIVDMVLTLLNNQGRLHEYQWKLVKRFIYIYCKDLLRL